MFCDPGHVSDGTEAVKSRYHVLRFRTHFRWYRGCPISFSSLPRSPGLVSAIPRATGPVFMFCASGLVFDSTVGVGTRFQILRARIRFRRYQGRRFPFSCFARPDSFSTVPRASGPVFMFCVPEFIFGGTDGVGSSLHVLRSQTSFQRCRVRWVPFSCFAHPDSFSAVPKASTPVFIFFRSRTRFRWYRVHRVPFSCVPILDTFLAVPRASGLDIMFCAPTLVFSGTEGIRSHFHVSRSRARFRRYRGRPISKSCFAFPDSFSAVLRAPILVFMFYTIGFIFGGTEGFRSRFHVLRAQTHFRRYRGCWVPFSCFALPNSFSPAPSASGPVFMFCAPGLIFDCTEGVRSRFVCFPLPIMFLAVRRASGPVFMFCDSGHVFDCTGGVGSRFHVLHASTRFGEPRMSTFIFLFFRSRTRFRRYGGYRVPFSCFARPVSFSSVSRASGTVFMFCDPGHVFGGMEGVRSLFHVWRSRTHFRRYRGRRFSFKYFTSPD
jgi:hypothetical protein